METTAPISYDFCRWKGLIPDALVMMFGANVAQRVRHIANRRNRHLWKMLYEKTGLLLDVAIVALMAFSKCLI